MTVNTFRTRIAFRSLFPFTTSLIQGGFYGSNFTLKPSYNLYHPYKQLLLACNVRTPSACHMTQTATATYPEP